MFLGYFTKKSVFSRPGGIYPPKKCYNGPDKARKMHDSVFNTKEIYVRNACFFL